MTFAVIALAVALVGAMGIIVWLVKTGNTRVDQVLAKSDQLSDARKEIVDKTLIAERALFEKEKATNALQYEQSRSDALEDFISADAKETNPTADLAPDDVAGRLLRFSRKSKNRDMPGTPGTDNPVSPEPGPVLHPEEGPGITGPVTVP